MTVHMRQDDHMMMNSALLKLQIALAETAALEQANSMAAFSNHAIQACAQKTRRLSVVQS